MYLKALLDIMSGDYHQYKQLNNNLTCIIYINIYLLLTKEVHKFTFPDKLAYTINAESIFSLTQVN